MKGRARPSGAGLGLAALGVHLALQLVVARVATAQGGVDQGGGVRTHVVVEGDTCAALARRYYGSATAHDAIHAANPGLGPPPHRLVPGAVLRIPRPGGGAADATLTAARRRVTARGPRDDAFRPAREGLSLVRGHQVATEAQSSAEVTFRDRTVVQLREHSLLVIYGGSGRLARPASTATLERGALRSRLDELGGRLAVSMPASEATVGAGEAVVAVGTDGSSVVSNLGGGDATVRAAEVEVRVPAGTGTLVRRGQAPAAPRPLPAAPRWANDLAGRFVGLTGRGGTVAAGWLPVEGAARYRVELASRPDGGDVVAAVEVTAERESFEVHGVPAGVYYASVATIDREGLEGAASPRRAMRVLSARIIEPGGLEPVEHPYDPGDPSRPYAAPRVLPGTFIVSPMGFRCVGDDGAAAGMVTLRAPGRRTVACLDAADREVPGPEVEVVAVPARVEAGAPLVRGRSATLAVTLGTELPLPDRLHVRLSPGARLSRLVRGARGVELTIEVAADAPDPLEVALGVMAGLEHVPIATARVPVRDEDRPTPPLPRPPPAPPPPPPYDPFASLALSESLVLSDPATRGVRAWGGLAVLGAAREGDRAQARASAGVRAQVFDEPLRLGFAWSLELGAQEPSPARRGDADLSVAASFVLEPAPEAELAFEVGLLLPTFASSGGLATARLAPSVHGLLRVSERVALRARQGVLFDAGSSGARLYAGAVGLQLRPLAPLALAAELDASLGRGLGGDRLALAAGLGASLSLGPLELGVALRLGLTPDAREALAPWALSVQIAGGVGR